MMHILKRQNSKQCSSQKGKKSLMRRVFSSEKKFSQSSSPPSSLKILNDDGNGSIIGASRSKLSQTLSLNSIPGLAEADSFESIWATRSDSSSADEAASCPPSLASSPSFEAELSHVLQETIETFAELDVNLPNVNHVAEPDDDEEEDKGLEIDCLDHDSGEAEGVLVTTTPPSSTSAIFSGDFCDFPFASDSSSTAETAKESTTPSPPQAPSPASKAAEQQQSRSQDIFRPMEQPGSSRSLVPQSPDPICEKIDDDLLQVKFTPSFEGIEMTRSFQQLETIAEEASWYSPSLSFEMDHGNTIKRKNARGVVQGRHIAAMMMLLLLVSTNENRLFAFDKVGMIPLTKIIAPALERLLVQDATDGKVVKKTFYNSHHTLTGVWLK